MGDTGTQVGDPLTAEGVAHFEKRYTFVPYDICQGIKQCPQSQPYWALVLQAQDGVKYEVDQVFDQGDDRAPDLVHLDGKLVRDGSQLKVEGNVEFSAPDYYILGEVHGVNLIMWYGDEIDTSYPNWNCSGQLDRDTEIRVAVWDTGPALGAPLPHYGLRLTAIQESAAGPQSFPLASFNNVRAYSDRDTVIYEAASTASNVQLAITGAAVNPTRDHLDARLQFSLAQLPTDLTKIPQQNQVAVSCARVR